MNLHRNMRVLVVEDDFLVGEMVRGLLEDLGYAIAGEAADGRQAVELAGQLRPDVIVMDIEMPYLDGIDATAVINDCCPAPVVILTAHETPELRERARQAGVGAYLVKPPKARELERAIAIAVARFDDILALRRLNAERDQDRRRLQAALDELQMLRGLLPICASCFKVRNDDDYWAQVEHYVHEHPGVDAGRAGLCAECAHKFPRDY